MFVAFYFLWLNWKTLDFPKSQSLKIEPTSNSSQAFPCPKSLNFCTGQCRVLVCVCVRVKLGISMPKTAEGVSPVGLPGMLTKTNTQRHTFSQIVKGNSNQTPAERHTRWLYLCLRDGIGGANGIYQLSRPPKAPIVNDAHARNCTSG